MPEKLVRGGVVMKLATEITENSEKFISVSSMTSVAKLWLN